MINPLLDEHLPNPLLPIAPTCLWHGVSDKGSWHLALRVRTSVCYPTPLSSLF